MGHRGPGGGFLPMIVHLLGCLVGLALLALLVFLLFKLARKQGWLKDMSAHLGDPPAPAAPPRNDPLTILDERLARGDIDVEDYRARRAALTDRGGGYPPFPPEPSDPQI